MWNKILLVDDNEIFRKEFIKCFDEWNIIDVSNGEEALRLLNQPNEISLVILDINMPCMDGIEVLNRIKQIAPKMGIIILTGCGTKEIAIKALRGKADDFIEKPFDIEKTTIIIETLIEKLKFGESENSGNIIEKIEHIKSYLQKNCCKKVPLTDSAELVNLSPKYLSRAFKQITGMCYNQYRLNLKIEKAKELLNNTGFNIDQISRKLAYENSESFISQFKKITKLTPTEFRKG